MRNMDEMNYLGENDAQRIQDIVGRLREVKESSFANEIGEIDFAKVTETCRVADIFSLPFFYLWEHLYKRELKEIWFDEHLTKAYERFIKDPQTNTWLLYLFITVQTPLFQNWTDQKLPHDISNMYREMMDKAFGGAEN